MIFFNGCWLHSISMEDDDLYHGFGEDGIDLGSHAPKNLAPLRAGDGVPRGAAPRPGTGAQGAPSGPRPMTSVAGAGYRGGVPGAANTRSSTNASVRPSFKPENAGGPEVQVLELESRVHTLLESSAFAASKGDPLLALERAKEAGRREKALWLLREERGGTNNIDLYFSVNFNLATMVSHQSHGTPTSSTIFLTPPFILNHIKSTN